MCGCSRPCFRPLIAVRSSCATSTRACTRYVGPIWLPLRVCVGVRVVVAVAVVTRVFILTCHEEVYPCAAACAALVGIMVTVSVSLSGIICVYVCRLQSNNDIARCQWNFDALKSCQERM